MNEANQTKWNLNLIAQNEKELQEHTKVSLEKALNFINKWKDRRDYVENAKALKESLDEYESIMSDYGFAEKESYYYYLQHSLDKNNPEILAKLNLLKDKTLKIINEIRFYELNISKIEKSKQTEFLTNENLLDYKHFLEKIFNDAKYILTEKEENILALLSAPAFSNWTKMTSGFIAKEEGEIICESGKKEIKNFSELISSLESLNKETRDSAAKCLNTIFYKYQEITEKEINSILETKKVEDMLRGATKPDELRHVHEDTDSSVVESLIKSLDSNIQISQEFYKLKAKLLNVEKLEYHERNIPYGNLSKEYTYEKGVEVVLNTFEKLDIEFKEILQNYTKRGCIDVYPSKGKSGGAFCTHTLPSLPIYVLLNWTDKLTDVTTLAHEMGHAINFELIAKSQNSLNQGTSLTIAEVASTFMEDFVLDEIAKDIDDETKLTLAVNRLEDFVQSVFRQLSCYKFELELHNAYRSKGYLTYVEIGEIFQKHMKFYMGDGIEQSKGSENWWIYWSHIRSFFYVYSYASGLIISKSLQSKVKENKEYINEIKEFLKVGTSVSPVVAFKNIGLDITDESFWDEGFEQANELLQEIKTLGKKLNKL